MHQFENKSICFITETNGFGGVEIHTLSLIKALITAGYLIELIANRHYQYDKFVSSNELKDKVVIIHTDLDGITSDGRYNYHNWKSALSYLGSKIVIIPKGHHSHGRIGFLRACHHVFKKVFLIEHLEAELVPKRPSKRYLGLIPSISFWWYRYWYKKIILKRISYFYADHIIAVSEKVKERLVYDWSVPEKKVAVVKNGVAWQKFIRNEKCGILFRHQYKIPSDAFVFGILARLSQVKGIDIALQALHLLVKYTVGKSFYLVIAGDGPDEKKLRDLTIELNLQRLVKFIGFVSNPEKILSGFDVILFASRKEGLPLGLLEGMAAGCIPIVTQVGGMPEVVNESSIGWVVSPENFLELFEAMQSVLKLEKIILSEMRRNALCKIQEHFDITRCHREIFQICGL